MKACISSQTPFIKFNLSYAELLEKYGTLPDVIDINDLEEEIDYDFSPGGVTAMVYPLLKRMLNQHTISKVNWVSLGIKYPPKLRVGNILVSHLEMPESVLRNYTTFKENLWSQIHGLSSSPNIFDSSYEGYVRFNWLNAESMLQFWNDTDVFYVQDYQLLPTGGLIGPPAPAIIRWHVPFAPENLPFLTRRAIVKWIEAFDGVVVSTRRDLEGLIKVGYRGRAHQVYPFIDPQEWGKNPSQEAIENVRQKVGLKPDEKLLLMVARMDRMKSQDVAIKAFSHLKNNYGKVKLALIGNGSFSSSKKGGLGHGKGSKWKSELEVLVNHLHVEDSVVFLGHASAEEVRAAYSISSIVLLTSNIEGFGISVLEGWMNKKPVVVSKGAGSSELVVDGSNGYTFSAGNFVEASEAILKALKSDHEKIGENGFETCRQCYLDRAVEREKTILEEAMSIYKR
ncbi:MAG: glycosyltransferase family 4 protein [Nitrososphaerales archaeon]